MPSKPSPSSSVQRAREELATRLRELRLDAGLTGRAHATAAGWHESKTSRIESGKQALTDTDIRTWCRVCGADEQATDLIEANRVADSMYVEWRRLHRAGMRRAQELRIPLYERTRWFKVYCSTVIPGFFQTPGYATALMTAITRFQDTPDDVADAVTARMARNHVLHGGERRFAAIVEESVLRARHGDAQVMAAQLGHLLAVSGLPAVSLGIVPLAAPDRPIWTLEAFNIFDDTRVEVELLSAQVTVTQPSEVAVYVRAFEQLSHMAVYGSSARSLITQAIEALDQPRD
ncbi:helix-turn-helix transcriptional regulator [Spirillospora sp. NPDC052269]